MAWTAPRTWVTAEVVTASLMNTEIRDNLLETAPAIATGTSRLIVSDGMNSIAERQVLNTFLTTAESTTSTSYTDLATAGPAVTVTTGTDAIVIISALMSNNSVADRSLMAYAISGATTKAESDNAAFRFEAGANQDISASKVNFEDNLTAGSNTFTAKYRVTGGTGSFDNRDVIVIPL